MVTIAMPGIAHDKIYDDGFIETLMVSGYQNIAERVFINHIKPETEIVHGTI